MAHTTHVVLTGWSEAQAKTAFAGDGTEIVPLHSHEDASAVVLAAASGVRVVVLASSDVPATLLDDLRRLGGVDVLDPPVVGGPHLHPESEAILNLLADGMTLGDAAAELHLSRRTADRRVAAARDAYRVATTAEVVIAHRTRLSSTPTTPARSTSTQVIGRDELLSDILRAIDSDESILLVGEGGIGKSTLLHAIGDARRCHAGGGQETLRWRDYVAVGRAIGRVDLTGDVEAVADQVERAVGPDVLIVDDLHLADEASISVLRALRGRLAIVAASRPDPADATVNVVKQLIGEGFREIPVEPLTNDACLALVKSLAPRLSPPVAQGLIERSVGIPLLVEAMARGGTLAQTASGLVPPIDALDENARFSALCLAVAGDALPADAHTDELIDCGLAARAGDHLVRIRHALIADTIIEQADPEAVILAHRRVAELTQDPGQAAAHWWAAGDLAATVDAASRAADLAVTQGERARYLRLAAEATVGPERGGMLRAAALELSRASQHEAVLELLTLPESSGDDPLVQAHNCLLGARAHWHLGDAEAAITAANEGLALVGGTDAEVEGRLLLERVRCEALSMGVQPEHDGLLARAETISSTYGRGRGAVLNVAGMVGHLRDGSGGMYWKEGCTASLEEGDIDSLMRCSNNVITWHESAGDPAEGLALAAQMTAEAESLGLGEWTAQFRAMAANLLFHRGRYADALAELDLVDASAVDARTRMQARYTRAGSLIDLGLLDDALALLKDSRGPREKADWLADDTGRYLRALASLWSGRPRVALGILEPLLRPDVASPTFEAFPRTVEAWARYDLGLPVVWPEDVETLALTQPMLLEVQGVSVLADDPGRAIELLDEAAETGRAWSLGVAIRAAWAAGEARRLAAHTDAVASLLSAEEEALAIGLEPVLVRIRRSLRLAGVHRVTATAPDRSGLITARERAVLDLVAQGRTYAEIARRLGVGRPTVRRLLDNARAKLGATDRLSAAAGVVTI